MTLSLPAVLPFELNTDAANHNKAWKKWTNKFENYLLASGVRDDLRQKALLLHCVGDPVQDIFCALPGNETTTTYAEAKDLLTTHFAPKQNADFEVFKFRETRQGDEESVDDYHVRLRSLASYCAFTNLDLELKRQIVQTCKSKRLRRAAFENPSLTLDQLLEKGRLMELSESQASTIEKTNSSSHQEVAHYLGNKQNRTHQSSKSHAFKQSRPSNSTATKPNQNNQCGLCGGTYPHPKSCPAKGKTCHKCGKLNHFSTVCRSSNPPPVSKRIHSKSNKSSLNQNQQTRVTTLNASANGTDEDDKDTEFLFTLFQCTNELSDSLPLIDVTIADNKVSLLMDTGASGNLLNQETYESLEHKPSLHPSSLKIYPYGSNTPLKVIGRFDTNIKVENTQSFGTFYVTCSQGQTSPSLLGYPSLCDLQIISPPYRFLHTVNIDFKQDIVAKYPKLFQGIGLIKGVKIKLAIDDSVKPIAQPHRRIPFHLREALDEELDQLLKDDIIEPLTGQSSWVSPAVLVIKGKSSRIIDDTTKHEREVKRKIKLRLCVDMRIPNTAIIRVRHVMPTIEDVIQKLNGATVFSKLDLNKGYHQLSLDESSRDITTFSTHRGLFRYKRLSFGISSAAEIFHHAIYCIIQDINKAFNVSDDLLVFGVDFEEHDQVLEKVLHRLEENNITLNKAKCEFRTPELEFYGHVFGKSGISVHQSKVKTLQSLVKPQTPDEIRSLLGLATYCSRFIPNFSDVTLPLRVLTKKNTEWNWTDAQDSSLALLKHHLNNDTILSYFDSVLPTTIYVDASQIGLGAILTQRDRNSMVRIISFASKALTDVETRYSQTEREALAVVWSCEHYHLYIYGSRFTVITDHLPLLTLLGNPKAKTSARIERWNLRLAPYDLHLEYKPGKLNPADYLSRHPLQNNGKPTCFSQTTETHLHQVVHHAIPKAITYEDVKRSSKDDTLVQDIIHRFQTDQWRVNPSNPNIHVVQRFETIKSELTIVDGIILKGHRIHIPTSLQQRVIDIAHEGHLGLVKTKQLLRTKVWFPNMDVLVEQLVKSCVPCLASTPHSVKEPLLMTKLPDRPWSHLAIDHLGPFKNGQYLIVLMDEQTRFPLAEIVSSTSADVNVKVLSRIFSIFGIPEVIKTDNGPPFNSHEFKDYLLTLGVHHRKITPYWPQANGTAERFMASLNKTIRAADVAGTDWKDELQKFLSNYRNTPHSTTGSPPSYLIFGRSVKTKLPSLTSPSPPQYTLLRDVDSVSKEKMKSYHDNKKNAKPSQLQPGDQVLVKSNRTNKMSPYFDPVPYEVTATNGSMVTAKRNGHTITRNCSFYKRFTPRNAMIEPDGNYHYHRPTHTNTSGEAGAPSSGLFHSPRQTQLDVTPINQTPLSNTSPILDTPSTNTTVNHEPIASPSNTQGARYNLRQTRMAPKRLINEM